MPESLLYIPPEAMAAKAPGKEVVPKDSSLENNAEYMELVAGRRVVATKDLLKQIQSDATLDNLREVASLLLSNDRLVNNSTILRGKMADGSLPPGQTILRGNLDEMNPQVYIREGLEDNEDIALFARTVEHELIHSFTMYITKLGRDGKQGEMNETENEFFKQVSLTHVKFLEKNKTGDPYLDSLNEFIAKSLTCDQDYTGSAYYQEVFSEFKKLYENNQRNINSLSNKVAKVS